MLGVNLPFRRFAGIRKILITALASLALLHTGAGGFAAEGAQASSFLKLSEGQRYWWINGAVLTASHLVATRDMQKGDCVARWYLDDRAAKQKLIEETLAKYQDETPTTVVLGLVTQACGELLPASNR